VLLSVLLPDWRRRPGWQLKSWWTVVRNDLLVDLKRLAEGAGAAGAGL